MEIDNVALNQFIPQEASTMDELTSFVPKIVSDLGWTDEEFIGRCVMRKLSMDTARKLLRGDTNITVQTLATAANILGKSDIGQVMNIRRDGDE